ncbi:MAG: polyhydroxyalkanoic acid synthase [Rubrivivax sp.]|nr:polyhydroxyalkanoic acid synthase [Rubrivivax sp.]
MDAEQPSRRLDRLLHAAAMPLTRGLSPVSLSLAWADWAWHLALTPGRQMELAAKAASLGADAARVAFGGPADEPTGDADDDPRFRDPAWERWPYSAIRHTFRNQEAWWREAASAPGMTEHHAALTQFFARQWLGMLTPANGLWTNPVVLQDAIDSRGTHLAQGAMHALRDATGQPDPERDAEAARYVVGRDVAATPGDVVFRNQLIELIRYAPQTATVRPEPVVIVPSWIMKYYILDLSPHNSLARYLVQQGHVVYMLSWRNPDEHDRDLSMDDYLRLGVLDALQAVGALHGPARPVHAMGYCLGGTLLAIAAASLAARHGPEGEQRLSPTGVPPLATLTLLAAQTDFAHPGELGLFIDESQVAYLDEITRGPGYLTGPQMAGSFQFLHSRELVWSRAMREYLLGTREPLTDLTAWNADTTRLPARMHHEYLVALYLKNALAAGRYRVGGRAVSLSDLGMPVFLVGTERDHVSPWRSVYQLHRLSDAEITFVLTSGGHNAGIVSEPGHAGRRYRILRREAHGGWVPPEAWTAAATPHDGSWWPAWQQWLAAHSGRAVSKARVPKATSLGPAPGEYVLQRYDD